jgi:hypothetical protein
MCRFSQFVGVRFGLFRLGKKSKIGNADLMGVSRPGGMTGTKRLSSLSFRGHSTLEFLFFFQQSVLNMSASTMLRAGDAKEQGTVTSTTCCRKLIRDL